MLQGHFPTVRHCLLVIYQITQSLYGLPGISEKDSFRTIEVQRVIDRCSSVFLLKNYMIYIVKSFAHVKIHDRSNFYPIDSVEKRISIRN